MPIRAAIGLGGAALVAVDVALQIADRRDSDRDTRKGRDRLRRQAAGRWSGRRDSNPRHPTWKDGAPPTELLPLEWMASSIGSHPVTVRANHVALSGLDPNLVEARMGEHSADRERFRRRISMIELHGRDWQTLIAVSAGLIA